MKEDFTSQIMVKVDTKEDNTNIQKENNSPIQTIHSMLNLNKIEFTDFANQQRDQKLNGYNISFQDSTVFIDQNEQVTFEFKRQVEPVMINQEEKLQEECSKYQEYNKSNEDEEAKQKDKAASRRSLRDSVMKQQMMGSVRSSLSKNNSMLQELKNIQLEKKSNKVPERDIPQNLNAQDNQSEQNQTNSNSQLSPSLSENVLYLNKYYIQGNLNPLVQHQNQNGHQNQIDDPEFTIQNKSDISKSLSTQNLNNNDGEIFNNIDLNFNSFSDTKQTLQDISNNNNNYNNQNNANFDTKNSDNATSPLSNNSFAQNTQKAQFSQSRKRNFVHKQILGVLEQEGYVVEIDNQTKLEEQLEILQAQRELVRQASIDFETSRDSSPKDINDLSLDKQGSSSSKSKHRKRNNQSSPNANSPETFSPFKTSNDQQNKNIFKNICDNELLLSGNKQVLQTKSERFIPSPVLMKDIILDDYQANTDRRFSCNVDSKSAKRNLLRQNVFHTQVISKTPNSSTSNGGTTSWNNVNVQQEQLEKQNDQITPHQNQNSENHLQNNFSLDNYLKQQKGQHIQYKETEQTKDKSSSSPSLSDQEDDRRISQKSTETIKASCGGESTRNRSMRMNIGWNTVNTVSNKSQNSSDGDDEEDNKSGNNTNKDSQMKLANQFKQLTKYGTMDLDQDSDSSRKKADNKLNINLHEKYESNCDDDNEDRPYSQSVGQNSGYNSDDAEYSGSGSMTSKSGQYISKFQKYYNNLNNNFQFDSIEEMESSQESIQKSSTKNSQRIKYPGTTRAMPKLDNPSNFLQYINMRKSKRQGSKVDQQNNSENLQSNMSSSQNCSPEIHFSGVFKFNDAMSDLNIDYTQSVKTSLCKSPISPSKQLSLSQSNFSLSLNQVKYDESNTNISQQIKRVESENESPHSSQQQTPHSYALKSETFSSEVPSMLKLPNSQSLISNYLASVNKDLSNNNPVNSQINKNPTIISQLDLQSKILSEDNQKNIIEPTNNNNQMKQSSENLSTPYLFKQIQIQQIPNINLLDYEQQDQLKNTDQSNQIKGYLNSVSPKIQIDSSVSPKINTSILGQNTNDLSSEKQEIVNTQNSELKNEDTTHNSSPTQFINEYIKNLNQKSEIQSKCQVPQNEEQHQKIVFPLRYDILSNNLQKQNYSNISEHLTSLLQPNFFSQKDIQMSQTPREKSNTMSYLELQNFQNQSKSFVNSTSPMNSLSSQKVNFNTFSQVDSIQFNYNQKNQSPSDSSKYTEKPFSTLNTLNQQSVSNSTSTNDRNLFSQYFTDKDSYNNQPKLLQNNSSQQTQIDQNKYQIQNYLTPLKTEIPQNNGVSTINSPYTLQANQSSNQLNTNQAFGSSLLNNSSNPSLLNYSNPKLLSTQNLNASSPHALNASYPYSVNVLNPYSLNTSTTPLVNSNIHSASTTPLLKINEPLINASTVPLLNSPHSQNYIQNPNDHHGSQFGSINNNYYFIQSKTELHSPMSTSNISKQGNLHSQSAKNIEDLYQHLDLVKEDSMAQYTPMVNSILITNKNQSISTQVNSNGLSKSASSIYQHVQNTNENQFNLPQVLINNQENNNQHSSQQSNVQNTSSNSANNFTNSYANNNFDCKYLQNLSESTPLSSSQNNYYLNLQHQTSLNQNVSPSNSSKNNYDDLSQDFFPNKQIQSQTKSYSSIQNNPNFQNNDNNFSNNYFVNSEDTTNKNSTKINDQISQFGQTNQINSSYQNQYLGTSITTKISHSTSPYTTIQIQTKIETSIQNINEQPTNNNNQSIIDQIMQEYRSKMQNQQNYQIEAKSLNNLPAEREEDQSPKIDHQRNLTYSIPATNQFDFQKSSVQDQKYFSSNDKNFFYTNFKDNNVNNNSHINSSLDSVNKIYSALPSQNDFTHIENPINENSNNINNSQQNLQNINQKVNLQY
ncbi:hypothetical protein ABPG74_022106 [Tetrahymena malaccensis]